MSEPFIVGMTSETRAALERAARQQPRFRRFFLATELDYGTKWGLELRVGSFRTAVRGRGRIPSYRALAAARRKLGVTVRSATFRRDARHKRNKARHFGRGKVYHVFR